MALEDVVAFFSDPVVGATITFVTASIAFLMGRLRPGERTWWEDAKEWPGQAVLALTLAPGLAASLPGLVYEIPTLSCDPLPCHAVGGGEHVVEGTGFGAFVGQFVLSALIDVPVGVVGAGFGNLMAALVLAIHRQRNP